MGVALMNLKTGHCGNRWVPAWRYDVNLKGVLADGAADRSRWGRKLNGGQLEYLQTFTKAVSGNKIRADAMHARYLGVASPATGPHQLSRAAFYQNIVLFFVGVDMNSKNGIFQENKCAYYGCTITDFLKFFYERDDNEVTTSHYWVETEKVENGEMKIGILLNNVKFSSNTF